MASSLSIISQTLITLIRIYQVFISSYLTPHCRFYPTCSQYGIESLQKFGIIMGIFLIAKRILKCQPFKAGGYDPIPEKNFYI
ncbi:membrane protein insertion efficiency factor YidD [Candidatus Pantoea edessiphila]|uniref:Putative membrane protein insertion efficiency factor n=1 Tax=Candidatus Pantoea edessiphila TaxID=2044610 RepID=A0A2P5SZ91_9GAMM|nr:membrane protein insertion efficiency factor YidD [Candidatus Pantoea edessiphila]PPI87658.1 membrane protein insertion efficiency factor YidD [Candidatus Pantoea edessiphila]